MTKYKTLLVWQSAMQLVKEVYSLANTLPQVEIFGLTQQMKRAVVSIPANIAEGVGRSSSRDTLHFLHIARGSLYETSTFIDVAVLTNLATAADTSHIHNHIQNCARLLNGLINRYKMSEK